MEKQHNLLKLIIQKMEISSEADEYDGPEEVKGSKWTKVRQSLKQKRGPSSSKWTPVMSAIEGKKHV